MPMNDGENIPDECPDDCECLPCQRMKARYWPPDFNRRRLPAAQPQPQPQPQPQEKK